MKTLVICHVSEPNLRRSIHGKVKDYGFELERGLFECDLDESEFNELTNCLSGYVYKQSDCVRLYRLCSACAKKSLTFGQGAVLSQQPEWLIF